MLCLHRYESNSRVFLPPVFSFLFLTFTGDITVRRLRERERECAPLGGGEQGEERSAHSAESGSRTDGMRDIRANAPVSGNLSVSRVKPRLRV